MDETVRPPRKPVKRLRTDREREKIISLSSRNICCAVQSLSPLRHFVTRWTAARKASLSITSFRSLLKLISIKLVMLSNHLILCHPLLLLPSIFLTSKSFPESALCIRWPKYQNFSFGISPSSEYSGLISFRID